MEVYIGKWFQGCKDQINTLAQTSIAPENGWLEDVGRLFSFLEGLSSGAMLVCGRVMPLLFGVKSVEF